MIPQDPTGSFQGGSTHRMNEGDAMDQRATTIGAYARGHRVQERRRLMAQAESQAPAENEWTRALACRRHRWRVSKTFISRTAGDSQFPARSTQEGQCLNPFQHHRPDSGIDQRVLEQ